jgi:hypothetical protein
MTMRALRVFVMAAVGLVWLTGCGSSERGAPGAVEAESKASGDSRVQTAALPVPAGSRATLMRFAGAGRFEVTCRARPRVAFRVEDKTAEVGVDTGRSGERVQTLDPGQRLQARLPPSALLRWHIASSHGDGVRLITASVAVTPVRGGSGACLFSAQSTRSGQIP